MENGITLFKMFLEESGLDNADAERMGLQLLGATETYEAIGIPNTSSVQIPYIALNGEYIGSRWRLLNPPNPKHKYHTLPNSPSQIYYVPGSTQAAHYAEIPLWIVEGEKKAVALQKELDRIHMQCMVVGLPGVWNFTEKDLLSGQRRLHSAIQDLALHRRTVIIAHDNDNVLQPNGERGQKQQVKLATAYLAGELLARGARPYGLLWDIPGEEGKLGADDFIAQGGNVLEAMETAMLPLDAHLAPNIACEILEMNARFCMSHEAQMVWDRHMERYLKPTNMPVMFTRKVTVAEKKAPVSLAKIWLQHPRRLDVQSVDFFPYTEEKIVGDSLNTWEGFKVHPPGPDAEEQPELALWHKMLALLTAGLGESERKWFYQRIAMIYQQPGTRCNSAVILRSDAQGVGKSMFCKTLAGLCGKHGTIVGDSILDQGFNGYLRDQLVVIYEEVNAGKSNKVKNHFKNIVTEPDILINEKYQPATSSQNYANVFLTSNHTAPLGIDSDEDRRMFVVSVPHPTDELRMTAEEYHQLAYWLDTYDGKSSVLGWLLSIDLDGFKPGAAPPVTMAKQVVIAESQPQAMQWIEAVGDGDIEVIDYSIDRELNTAKDVGRAILSRRGMIDSARKYLRESGGGQYSDKGLMTLWEMRGHIAQIGAMVKKPASQGRIKCGQGYVNLYAVGKDSVKYWRDMLADRPDSKGLYGLINEPLPPLPDGWEDE